VGGLEKGVITLINRLPAERFRHAIISWTEIHDLAGGIERPDVELVALHKRESKDAAAYMRLYRVLRRMRPDILHSRNLGSLDAQWVAFLAGVRGRIHGENGRDTDDLDGTNFRYNVLRRMVRPFVHRYSAVSKDLANWLIRTVHVAPGRVHQIYNGVDSRRFYPRAGPRALPESGGILCPDSFIIGTVGRMAAVKNQLALVEAFLRLLAARPDLRDRLRLILVGDGPLRSACLDRLREASATNLAWLPGERADIPELLRAMDLFVLPSLTEGISNTILEAMASGLPVIATQAGGNPELVQHERTGMLVPVSDDEAMAAALAGYADRPELAVRQGETARAEAVASFTIQAMLRKYSELYDGVLAETRLEPSVIERGAPARPVSANPD
jgi:sugar transferase (PEP-CTERM/EpsH1 system associated)